MKKLLLFAILLFGVSCTSRYNIPFVLNAATDINDFDLNTRKLYVFPLSDRITDRNAIKAVENALIANNYNVTDKEEDAEIKVGFTFDIKSFAEYVNRPVFGKTGIRSINTNSNSMGNLSGQTNYFENYTTTNTIMSSNTNTYSNVNYDYGVTGYVTEEETHDITVLSILVIQKDKIIGSYKIADYDTHPQHILMFLDGLLQASLGANTDGTVADIMCELITKKESETLNCFYTDTNKHDARNKKYLMGVL